MEAQRVHPAVRRATDALAQDFRAGALAYAQGDPSAAAAALRRFLDAAPETDPRREDVLYVLVLSLFRVDRGAEAETAAMAYLREFPRGTRRPEVATELARAAARRGDCDRASTAALALPENTDARLRQAVAQALVACHAH